MGIDESTCGICDLPNTMALGKCTGCKPFERDNLILRSDFVWGESGYNKSVDFEKARKLAQMSVVSPSAPVEDDIPT